MILDKYKIFNHDFTLHTHFFSYIGYGEGVLLITLSLLIFPSNIWAIVKINGNKHLTDEFFTLVTSICGCNMAFGIIGIVNGIARMTRNHPLGLFGCTLSLEGGCIINTTCMYISTLISFERWRAVSDPMQHMRHLTKQGKEWSRIVETLVKVFIIFALATSVWTVGFFFYGVLGYFTYEFDHGDMTGVIANVCTAVPTNLPVLEISLLAVLYIVPFAFNSLCIM